MSTAKAFVDLSAAVLLTPPDLSPAERKAVTMLLEEVEKRSRLRWASVTAWPAGPQPVIAVGPAAALAAFGGPYAAELASGDASAPEGYRLCVREGAAPAVFVIGNDPRGVLYGVGRLLRTLRLSPGRALVPAGLSITTAPRYRLRGHQLGYRDKTNSYCGWDLEQWEQYYRDLIVFGANAIELIPPRSDDRPDSVHFPRPPLEMMEGMSRLADEYGLDLWIWFPAMDADYADPATVERALCEWGEVFQRLPRIDAIFVPGGDPGHARPSLLMPMLQKQAASLQRFHPQAQWWVSPQGFSPEWMSEFLSILRDPGTADWLTGVVHGPWVQMTTEELRRIIPERYQLRNYPDITHTLSCQFPVPDWDPAFALTVGREPVNPRPLGQATIFRHTMPPTIGFLTYSEGCHDDVNKAVWSALGWDPEADVIEVLREYSRYFIGQGYADDFAQGLLALERNWQGPLATNAAVYTTLQQFQALEEAAPPRVLKNWRFQQALYRAYYDAYVRSRLLYETALEEQAMDRLRQASRLGSELALAEAEGLLDRAVMEPISQAWRTRICQLAEALFQSIHMQLSVHLYQGQEEVRGANLDGLDYPLNNRPWLKARFEEIRRLPGEEERLWAIRRIVEWENPGPGGFYDNLGGAFHPPHVQPPTIPVWTAPQPGAREGRLPSSAAGRGEPGGEGLPLSRAGVDSVSHSAGEGPGEGSPLAIGGTVEDRSGYAADPGFLVSPLRRYPYRKSPQPLRLAWRGNMGPFGDHPFRLRYPGLDPEAAYRVRIIYGEQRSDLQVRLEAGEGLEVHPLLRPTPHEPVEFDIPRRATQGGELTLTWWREPGKPSGSAGFAILEVWLMKQQSRR